MADDPIRRLLVAAKLLYANAEGCAVNHYSDDFAIHGLPGWLTDCAADIQAAEQALAKPSSPAGGDVVRAALQKAEAEFEAIRLILVSELREPVRQAFWRAVSARDAIRAALSPSTSAAEPAALTADDERLLNKALDASTTDVHDIEPAPAAVESAQGVKEAVDAEREARARAIYEAMGFAYEGRTVGSRGPFGEWTTALKAADAIAALSPAGSADT